MAKKNRFSISRCRNRPSLIITCLPNRAAKEAIPITLSQGEIGEYVKRFTALDGDKKGFVTVKDLANSLKVNTKFVS